MPKRRGSRLLWPAVGLSLLLGLIGAFAVVGEDRSVPETNMHQERTLIGSVDISNLSVEQAASAVRAALSPVIDGEVTLVAGDAELALPSMSALGIAPIFDLSVDRMLKGWSEDELDPGEVILGGLVWRIDHEALEDRLIEFAATVYRPPANAKMSMNGGELLSDRDGRMLDVPEAQEAILRWLERWESGETKIALPVKSVAAPVRLDDLEALVKEVDGFGSALLTGFTTYYDETLEGRAANVRLAASLIDGIVLMPQEIFSFNETVGPRLIERGFHPAPEIVGEEFVEGVGGGICQVSSTLFNAVLYANLKVVERYRHSVPLGYVPPGRDATLQYGVMDFRFQNTLDEPIVIRTEVGSGRLRVTLWSSKPLPYDVELTSEQIEVPYREVIELDPLLGVGETKVDLEGANGRWIIVSKVIRDKESGFVAPPEIVSRNYYPPKLRRVRVGPDRFWSVQNFGELQY